MKKVIVFIVLVVAIFIITAFVFNKQQAVKVENNPFGKEKLHPATVEQLDDSNYQNLILPEELKKDLEKNKERFVYFYSPTCSHCKKTTPIVTPLAKDLNVDLVLYNVLEFQEGWDDYKIKETPTILYFKGGKEMDRIEGTKKEDVFKKWFESKLN
ncbi:MULTISPECIES: thioredoxin family protein [Bacillus]|uniref:thioredoxin family protein n=1 Tax=Bacillus TaxID=1386 RepID=UPI00030238C9|nr:thioredoxin family protein [Bacillus pseudomycoides]MED1597281.1 thioredoxin family protein [Bacillus pseudomycoides]MED4713678.1 thioredoxin family protein [Bacillus pseudomycoides]OOR49433.1 thiol reductase thioredoxin [Bacillus pseudomycoides]PDY14815.1 thioredoxin [Bacillus pseudomycoides]PEI45008.1 thioredoxin [Bacillus pseudomycoides]